MNNVHVCILTTTVHEDDPLTTVFCVAQLKYRGGPILVSEKKGCQLCHNTFSEPDCACLPGGTPVHIHCVAKKALDLPKRQHENAHRSNHTWSWSVGQATNSGVTRVPHTWEGWVHRATVQSPRKSTNCFPCVWGNQSTNKCLGVWDTIYSIHTTLTMNINFLINIKLTPLAHWLIFLALPYDWSSGCLEIFSF